ncbi:hypothetical protein [Nocardia sp. Marseille-Q1738]
MKRLAQAAFVIAITTAGITLGAGTASAYETGVIIGRENCEQVARQIRQQGFWARCNHIHGDRYYVRWENRPPSTGSFGS